MVTVALRLPIVPSFDIPELEPVKISVVIPAINEAERIESCIQSAWLAGGDEVIVVDGGSRDDTVSIANSQDCQCVTSPPGRGQQMNFGSELASGDVLVFLHADNWFEEDAFQQIRSSIRPPCSAWGGFRQSIESSQWKFRLIERGNSLRTRIQGLVYGDQGLFATRSIFEKVGGFPQIPLMEDFELSRRLCKISRPLLLHGPIHVDSRRWASTGVFQQTARNWSITLAYRMGQSPERLARKYKRHDQ